MSTHLQDELEAVNSIYESDTLVLTDTSQDADENTPTHAILKLPASPLSFLLSFPFAYPDVPPQIDGTQSTGPNTKKGEGEAAVNVLRDVLGRIYIPGQVCLFDLIEESGSLLNHQHDDEDNSSLHHKENDAALSDSFASTEFNHSTTTPATSIAGTIPLLETLSIKDLNHPPTAPTHSLSNSEPEPEPEPAWIASAPLTVSKSTFVARALHVNSLQEANQALSHLLSTNKKVANATHNITAWRIRPQTTTHTNTSTSTSATTSTSTSTSTNATRNPKITIQDFDDDGETAAGSRLLHLLQLTESWNVVVVVTRWYGGVKLGPDRFRLIQSVARECLVEGGFVGNSVGDGGGNGSSHIANMDGDGSGGGGRGGRKKQGKGRKK